MKNMKVILTPKNWQYKEARNETVLARKQHFHSRSYVSDLLEGSADFSKASEKQQEQ